MVDKHRKRLAAVTGIGAAVAACLCLGAYLTPPATAQFFDERFPFFGRPMPLAPPKPVDYSHAPAPKKTEKADPSELNVVVVLGDSMADWLGYGLELAEADTPEIAIVRRHRSISGLIYNPAKNELRNRSVDWPALARETLAKEQAQIVVMMIGLGDRDPIKEIQAAVNEPGSKGAPQGAAAAKAPADAAKNPKSEDAAKAPPDATQDSEQSKPAAAAEEQREPPQIAATELRGAISNTYEFRSEKWVELYTKRIDETIAALKSKGVPVFWVGLPPIRGPKSMSDLAFLNDLYRARAEKAGITYVDVWDGFVDEAGRFSTQGPDFEGQIRRLRAADGVYFTTAGARKLAHFVDREIQRALAHSGPVAIAVPVEPQQQQPAAQPGGPTPRPLAGPVFPLNAVNEQIAGEELLGAGSIRPNITDAVASRVLVRGDPMPAPAGRADDFVWPRRDVAPVGADPVVATTTLPMTPMLAERAPNATALATTPGGKTASAAAPAKQPRTASIAPGGPLRPPGLFGQQPPYRQEARRGGPAPFFFFFFGGR